MPHPSRLAIHFPVWRELKPARKSEVVGVQHCELAIHFPVWRELKLLSPSTFSTTPVSCYTLSRLKGIETWTSALPNWCRNRLAIHFPVWREWKLIIVFHTIRTIKLAIHFPVWRELKLGSHAFAWIDPNLLAIHFPVWRELKPSQAIPIQYSIPALAIHFPVWRELKLMKSHYISYRWRTCYTLSRLKGIET